MSQEFRHSKRLILEAEKELHHELRKGDILWLMLECLRLKKIICIELENIMGQPVLPHDDYAWHHDLFLLRQHMAETKLLVIEGLNFKSPEYLEIYTRWCKQKQQEIFDEVEGLETQKKKFEKKMPDFADLLVELSNGTYHRRLRLFETFIDWADKELLNAEDRMFKNFIDSLQEKPEQDRASLTSELMERNLIQEDSGEPSARIWLKLKEQKRKEIMNDKDTLLSMTLALYNGRKNGQPVNLKFREVLNKKVKRKKDAKPYLERLRSYWFCWQALSEALKKKKNKKQAPVTSKPTRSKGREKKELFYSPNITPEECQKRTQEQAALLRKIIRDKGMENYKLNATKGDPLNNLILEHVQLWIDKGLIQKVSGRALYRFLVEEVGIQSIVVEKTYSNFISPIF